VRDALVIIVWGVVLSASSFAGTLYLDFGDAAMTTAGNWNNITGISAGTLSGGLVDSTGVQTTAAYYCANGFASSGTGGLADVNWQHLQSDFNQDRVIDIDDLIEIMSIWLD